MIEQVLIKKTLKAGSDIWEEGSILNSPLPTILLEEAESGSDTVEILKQSNEERPAKVVLVAEKVEEKKVEKTQTSQVQTASGPSVVKKKKVLLKRRKR